ncbi:hypothetical protein J6590_009168 [Homalodisca vitripennis]|nr:hypothetical protein J6590_009168 [Homalodisca vitripennis]
MLTLAARYTFLYVVLTTHFISSPTGDKSAPGVGEQLRRRGQTIMTPLVAGKTDINEGKKSEGPDYPCKNDYSFVQALVAFECTFCTFSVRLTRAGVPFQVHAGHAASSRATAVALTRTRAFNQAGGARKNPFRGCDRAP